MPNKEAALLDICYPDFFIGYHRPVIAVPITGTTYNKEAGQELLNEIEYHYEMIAKEAGNPDGYTEEEIQMFQSLAKEMIEEKPDHLFVVFNEPVTPEEEEDEWQEVMYAYFAIIRPTYHSGIMFLDS